MLKKYLCLFFTFYVSFLFSQNLSSAFTKAKSNHKQLKKVLQHYEKTGDQQKYDAAVFLIKNITTHASIDCVWVDSRNNLIKFSEFDFSDFQVALSHLNYLRDSLKVRPRKRVRYDARYITAELLIKNIDLAFDAWRQNPWAKNYSFETFCEYILPYRNLFESLEDWREDYQFLINSSDNTLEYITDPVEACTQIIHNLKDFTFVRRRPDPTPILSPKQMLFRRQGTCLDLANFALLVCRAMGVAATIDYTPHYAASSNRHFWNTVVDAKGNHIPFNSNSVNESDESLPYIYNANRKRLGKVIRVTYSTEKEALASRIPYSKIPNGFLKKKNIKDVTSEYVPVSNLKIESSRFNDTIAYVNVFNLGKWRVVGWAIKNLGKFKFKNLGRDLVYLPSTYHNKKMRHLKYPFLIDKKGNQKELIPNTKKVFSATLSRENERKTDYIDFNTVEIIEGKRYTLNYWNGGWKTVGTSVASTKGVSFKNIPSNALLRLLSEKPDRFERIFTLDKRTHRILWY